MALDRTDFDASTDDSGSGTDGTIEDKAWFETTILDPVDAEIARLDAAIAAGSGGVAGTVHCVAYHTALQSVANNTATMLNLNSEDVDTHTMHDLVTNNSRLTIPSGQGGFYLLHGRAAFASHATGYRFLEFVKNGSAILGVGLATSVAASASTIIECVALSVLAAGDYVEIRATQTSGGALNIGNATYGYGNSLGAVRLA